ncbi:uncharacterized protein LAJ45_03960 [Morchella importuna]|uniref:uncharacterized protein n=1 Tax=Morchella importuna TaxID=1174673 RepID=UPI001E8D53C1|nr:uncharacterized protein LAJ45_03960 [Morchella importuna]KAH8151967.1 hypothetical protein LAJ45_03960 [Morchella importuna]
MRVCGLQAVLTSTLCQCSEDKYPDSTRFITNRSCCEAGVLMAAIESHGLVPTVLCHTYILRFLSSDTGDSLN